MTDVFEEVDEGLRQEKFESLWKQYRLFVFAGIALVIGAVAVNEYVVKPSAAKARAEKSRGLETALAALDNGNYAEAETALKAMAEGKSKLAPLAANYLARVKYEGGGDTEGAAQTLASIAKAEGGALDRIALLKLAYLNVDKQTLADLESTLGPVATEDSALGAMARELIAAKAFESGQSERARTEYNRLLFDANAPEGVRQRAEMALAVIPLNTEPAPAGAPAPEQTPPAKEPQK